MKYYSIFLYYTLSFIVLSILTALVYSYLDLSRNSSLGAIISCCSVYWATYLYGKKNGYFLASKQKWFAVFAITFINLSLQIAHIYYMLSTDNSIVSKGSITSGIILISTAMVGVFVLIGAYFGIYLAKKQLIKKGFLSEPKNG